MKVYDAASIRNIALVGHGGSGKTQLTSCILFNAGMVNRLGKVDDGNTVTDFDEEEIARKHTLSASIAFAEWNKTKINIIDTPGFANFFSDTRSGLRVADGALLLVDAVSGPEVQTEKAWEECEALGLPRLVVMSRMDRDRASLERTLDTVQATFGRAVVPIQMPIGEEKNFKGVVDLVGMKAYTWAGDGTAKATEIPVPADLSAKATAARDALIEMVAEADDSLMEKFFEAGTLTHDEFLGGLRHAVQHAKIFPVVCTSGTANVGIQPLLDAVVSYLPAASERTVKAIDKAGAETTMTIGEGGPTAVFVWKTIADPFAGRISLFRVMRGAIKADSGILNLTKDSPERLGHLLLLQGKTQTEVPEIKAGDIGAVAKLKDTQTNHTLGDKETAARFAAITFPEPVLAYAIEPKTRGDEEKISSAMQRLLEEDPTIRYSRDPQTHELLLSGQGQMHIEVNV
ncbi:MAG: GTP-binding protein, partial [Acidobacteria bacterium]|nr:GTP-binding protein [Acidobacteriota bacterium]